MDNWTTLQEEASKYRGTLVLDGFHVRLLLNIEEDEDDYYYVLFTRDNETYFSSCVGRIIFLKDELDISAYEYILDIWNLNCRILAK